jgi:Phytanoyl-CoA dioxygenase (PhyH).
MEEVLNSTEFIEKGFVRIDNAFPAALAAKARDILWKDIDADPNDASTWKQPVVRLGMYSQPPFIQAANTPVLYAAFDQLVGKGRWLPCMSMGTFPVRFPVPGDPGDTGWHVDVSFGDDPDFMQWRANWRSKNRALLMLFLFSDVGEKDAPTRIKVGSHLDMASVLHPAGEQGLTLRQMVELFPSLPPREEVLATGAAGTVYLCHPFLVHAAQPNYGVAPRFLAQPPLLWKGDPEEGSPVAEAIRLGIAHSEKVNILHTRTQTP